jgi:uncharacterized protein YbaR (Trm112 family)
LTSNPHTRTAASGSRGADRNPLAALVPLLVCPSCRDSTASLTLRVDRLLCRRCKTSFPVYRNGPAVVPWLFRDPEAVRLEWRARFNGFRHANASEQSRLEAALNENRRNKAVAERLTRLIDARETQRKQVMELLAPLKLGAPRTHPNLDRAGALHGKLPKQQGLVSYYANIFRDWSWDNSENDSLLETVRRVLRSQGNFRAGKLVTLGAGACRLSYDLHREYCPDLSVAVDINPLLIFLASRVIYGETVAFHEFPVAPLNKASFAVPRNCVAPQPLTTDGSTHFSFVLADAMDNPFKPGSFDTALTPWLIDIIPQSFSECARAVNQVLKTGGTWLNTGSLAFFHRNEAWCYSQEEVLKLLEAGGFEVLASERSTIPYLQSPASAHGRIERAFSFSARKVADSAPPQRNQYLPKWLVESGEPIPDLDEFVVAAANHLLKAQILAAIDGRRSTDEIALLVAKRYGLQISEARGAIQRILADLCEASSKHADTMTALE